MLDKIIAFFRGLRKRKLAPGEQVISANDSLFLEPVPEIAEGYDESKKTIVRLIGKKRVKNPYQVTGIEDVASKNNWKAWVYLAPVVVLIGVFLLYPLINTIFISFASGYNYATGQFDGFTLENFGVIFGLPTKTGGVEVNFVRYAIPNTLILTFVTVPIEIVLALIISVALNYIKWFQKFIQTVFFLPYVTNAVAVGLVFSVIFDTQGVINYISGSNMVWIYGANRWIAMIPLSIYIIWSSMPFKILIFLSGLQGIDKQYYQAAQIDACPKWKVLTRITFPLLSPQILYIMITSFISAFKQYTAVVAMFGGPGTLGRNSVIPDMETIVYYVYDNVEKGFTSRAAAAGVFLFVVILAFTFLQFGISKKRVYY